MSEAITWTNTRVSLGSIVPWEHNPRHISKSQAKRLEESWGEFGQVETIAVGPGLEVYNGHQRLSVLLKLHGPSYEIDARQSSRPLTEQERRKLVAFLHTGASGSWDWDQLASWPADELQEWGFDKELLDGWKGDIAALGNFLESEQEPPTDDDWIEALEHSGQAGDIDTVNMTFVLKTDDAEIVRASLARFGKDKNVSLVEMAKYASVDRATGAA